MQTTPCSQMLNSSGKKRWLLILIILVAAAFWSVLFFRTFRTLASPDQLDYAQIARHILRGDGFVTDIVLPLYLTHFPTLVHHPEFLRAPGFSVLVAGAEAFFGSNDKAVVSVSGLAYVLSVGFVYLFGERLSGSRSVAVLAALLTLVNQEMVKNSQAGLADMTFAFYLTVLIYLLWCHPPPMVMGAALGLGYLLRYNLLIMLPGFLLFWWLERPKNALRYLAVTFGAATLVVSPWLIRNFTLAGSPLFTWPSYQYVMGTMTYPGQELYRLIESVNISQFILTHPREMFGKMADSARYLYNELPGVTNFFIVSFFVVSVLSPFQKDRRARILQYSVLAMASCQALALLPMEHEKIRLFFPFVPLMTIYAAQLFDTLLATHAPTQIARNALMAAAVLIVAVPTLPEFTGKTYRWDFEQAAQDLRNSEVSQRPDALIITDAPWTIAWYFDRTAVQTPKRFEDFQKIEAMTDRPVYVFFFYVGDNDRYQRAEEYRTQYFENETFLAEYELVQTFEDGAKLFRRRNHNRLKR